MNALELNSIEEIIADIRAGRMVILMDDADRENEGDLILAGECVTPEAINFMARYGRGLICLTLTEGRCRQLNLPLMVADNNDISAADRAVTVQAEVRADARPGDIVMPGHIFPLRAQPGGVLTRAGHTEAGCDLARLAGFEPAAVIVEILNEDGTMARYPQLLEFARTHGLKIGTIADLIRDRVEQERSVEWVAESSFESEFGSFRLVAFHENDHGEVHLALVMGDIRRDEPTLVRVQQASVLRDILGAQAPGRWTVRRALATIADHGRGVLVLLSPSDLPKTLLGEVQAYKMRHLGVPLPGLEPNPELRMYGVGAQILAQLGVGRMRIMGKPRKLHGLAGFGLELVDFLPPEAARED
jgi:3,4-dihydroxy 2-butanone 4-phosphate synthase/GTP cyclohydrolase II